MASFRNYIIRKLMMTSQFFRKPIAVNLLIHSLISLAVEDRIRNIRQLLHQMDG